MSQNNPGNSVIGSVKKTSVRKTLAQKLESAEQKLKKAQLELQKLEELKEEERQKEEKKKEKEEKKKEKEEKRSQRNAQSTTRKVPKAAVLSIGEHAVNNVVGSVNQIVKTKRSRRTQNQIMENEEAKLKIKQSKLQNKADKLQKMKNEKNAKKRHNNSVKKEKANAKASAQIATNKKAVEGVLERMIKQVVKANPMPRKKLTKKLNGSNKGPNSSNGS